MLTRVNSHTKKDLIYDPVVGFVSDIFSTGVGSITILEIIVPAL